MSYELIDAALTPDGARISLARKGANLFVSVNNQPLMASHVHGSEEVMAEVVCGGLKGLPGIQALVGGLGMGYTLRATLDALGPDAVVTIAELIPAVVAWNRGPLGPLAGHPLADPRVRLFEGDVQQLLRQAPPASFDVMLFDIDNGPEAFTTASNGALYSPAGLQQVRRALRPGGVVCVWSAFEAPEFLHQLRAAGMGARYHRVRARGHVEKGSRHILYLGQAPRVEAAPTPAPAPAAPPRRRPGPPSRGPRRR